MVIYRVLQICVWPYQLDIGELGYTGNIRELGYPGHIGELGYPGHLGELGYPGHKRGTRIARIPRKETALIVEQLFTNLVRNH